MSYYDILEVSPKASKEVIKNAYRALSKKYHPDTYKGDLKYAQEKMKEINTAYETLMDEEKRLVYDYENGYKIDPNSVVEQYAQAIYEKEEKAEHEKEENKKDIFKILKEKKYITIAGVCAVFIIAVFIGNLIAGVGEKKDNNKETSTKPVTTTTTTNNNNNSYEPSYNPTTQNTTKTEEKKEEPKQEEIKKEEQKTEENKQTENIEETTPQEPVGQS